jgi:hypothetical protein
VTKLYCGRIIFWNLNLYIVSVFPSAFSITFKTISPSYNQNGKGKKLEGDSLRIRLKKKPKEMFFIEKTRRNRKEKQGAEDKHKLEKENSQKFSSCK